jgi:uncharacterized membrane protein YqjE
VSSNLAILVILMTLFHVAALAVILLIRFWPTDKVRAAGTSVIITPCAVCGEPSTR